MKISSLLFSSFLLASSVDGFTTAPSSSSKATTTLRASSNNDVDNEGDDSRRQFMSKSVATAFTTMGVAGSGVLAPLPANAASGADKINARLRSYGLPSIVNIPSGMKPLLEVYGKGKNRFPLLVLMNHPLTWVVQLPSNDVNGEDGTVQAGEYAKGDTATFFLYEPEGHIDNIYDVDKKLYEKVLIAAISQKGGNMYQDFKVIKSTPQVDNTAAYGDRKYVICDFKYTLLTGAGFEVERRGVASLTSEGPAVEALWAASTRERFKKTETTLRDIVSSFRCYGDGVNFSAEIAKNDSRFDLDKSL
ncbi:hypothetical protein FRACYDRAFT_252622 [Fragilariopsis cylindrus CCMP1102]|uniref:Uncharacterized protein n=1 Tax=Fragilariopsis cylindrus CCMP1102 TaxID=635003 RepID=A0A1E7EM36_9STRA|nr:hypothetical protein FRACYDRAFT_252622 [Fragilariopsis cylindrus CCMP1102]|eukprot:OEU06990.1 hypothetical protein FRACYDRAFT_252622 [Fragilariopsis cylindrus CCMP1102]